MTFICREKNYGSITWRLEDGNYGYYKGNDIQIRLNKKKLCKTHSNE